MIDFTWLAGQDTAHLPGYLIALAIGLLVGLERERKPSAKAGLRTCALVSLTGAVAAALAQTFSAPSILAVGLGAIAFMIVAAYYHHHEAFHDVDSGTTTIAAVIACYLLGALVMARTRACRGHPVDLRHAVAALQSRALRGSTQAGTA